MAPRPTNNVAMAARPSRHGTRVRLRTLRMYTIMARKAPDRGKGLYEAEANRRARLRVPPPGPCARRRAPADQLREGGVAQKRFGVAVHP